VVRAGNWGGWALDYMLGMELRGKQLGLVGMGRIGRAVAAKAPAFGMTVAYTARTAADISGAMQMPLDRLLATSDVVSLHCPMTPDTQHLIDQKALARMKRTAYLVNTSRGPVVNEAALAWALRERLIAGAALDVYEREPEIHPELMKLENAHRDGRSRGVERHCRPEWPAADYPHPIRPPPPRLRGPSRGSSIEYSARSRKRSVDSSCRRWRRSPRARNRIRSRS
jgi:hypothetical protein